MCDYTLGESDRAAASAGVAPLMAFDARFNCREKRKKRPRKIRPPPPLWMEPVLRLNQSARYRPAYPND